MSGGMCMDAPRYSADVREVALGLIRHSRDLVELPAEAMRGMQFKSDEGVMWRLESNTRESDFLHDPLVGIFAALTDAAKSDWYYTHEKDWGEHDGHDHEYECEEEGC